MSLSNKEKLSQIIDQSVDEVTNDYHPINNAGGWHQFFKSQKVGVVASAQAILLLSNYNIDFPETANAFTFLARKQRSSDNGWSYITNLSDHSVTESTCWALQALNTRREKYNKRIDAGIEWLINSFSEKAGGWNCLNDATFRLYSTCIALKTLKLFKSESNQFRTGLQTVKRAQNPDGGWGDIFHSSSTLVHTAIAINTLIDLGMGANTSQIKKGVIFIVKALHTEIFDRDLVMGYVEIIDLTYKVKERTKSQRITFYHMPLPYALAALIRVNSEETELIYQGILSLMEGNEYGHWRHPYLPNQNTIWSVFDVLSMFKTFKNSSFYENFNEVIYKQKNSPRKKYDVIIFTVVPVEFITLNKILKFAPKGKREDFCLRGLWYYEYSFLLDNGTSLACLITMIGSAGDVDCSMACHTTFNEFDCDLAVLCGIAAGNKEDLNKYDAVIAEDIVAYEFQRLEIDNIVMRPKHFNVTTRVGQMNRKIPLNLEAWKADFKSNIENIGLDVSSTALPKFSVENAKLKTGTIASGAKLIADEKTLNKLKQSLPNGKGIIAAEMEGSGFAPACAEYKIDWVVIRGISDYGEGDKNDPNNKKYQSLAAASAVSAMTYYLRCIYRKL